MVDLTNVCAYSKFGDALNSQQSNQFWQISSNRGLLIHVAASLHVLYASWFISFKMFVLKMLFRYIISFWEWK